MRIFRWAMWSLLGMVFLLVVYLWLAMLSPLTYTPEGSEAIPEGEHKVFVYGTLRHTPVRWMVYGLPGDPEEAVLLGYRREGLDLVRDDEGRVDGLLLKVDERELARLDRYERLGIRYHRVPMTLKNGQRAWVYRRL